MAKRAINSCTQSMLVYRGACQMQLQESVLDYIFINELKGEVSGILTEFTYYTKLGSLENTEEIILENQRDLV